MEGIEEVCRIWWHFLYCPIGGLHRRHVGVQNKRKFVDIACIKMEVNSQKKKILLFLYTNMAAMTSHANHRCCEPHFESEAKCKFFHMKLVSFAYVSKLIFIIKKLHLASLSYWELKTTHTIYEFSLMSLIWIAFIQGEGEGVKRARSQTPMSRKRKRAASSGARSLSRPPRDQSGIGSPEVKEFLTWWPN